MFVRWASADTTIIIGYDETWTPNSVLAYFLFVYSGTGVFVVVFAALKIFITQLIGLAAARRLHSRMLDRMVKAPVSFFVS